jgi:hypothetical protein
MRKASCSGGELLTAEAFERVTPTDHEAKWQTSGSQTDLVRDLTLSPSANEANPFRDGRSPNFGFRIYASTIAAISIRILQILI